MPLFGPSQYSRHVKDSLGMLHVNTPCLIFNQPQMGSNRREREKFTGKYEFFSNLDSIYLPPCPPQVVA